MTRRVGTKGVPRADREDQILDIAADEYARRGYTHTSVAGIAARAGISKPLIYGYFESKDGLYLACLRRAGDALVAQIDAAQHGPHLARAVETLNAIFRTLEPRRGDWSLLYDPTLPEGSEVHAEAMRYRRRLADQAAAGTRELLTSTGSTDRYDASLLAQVWQSVVTAAVRWWLDHPGESADTMTERVVRLLAAITRASD